MHGVQKSARLCCAHYAAQGWSALGLFGDGKVEGVGEELVKVDSDAELVVRSRLGFRLAGDVEVWMDIWVVWLREIIRAGEPWPG